MVLDLGDEVHVRRSDTVQEIRQPHYDAAFEDVVRVIEVDGFEIDQATGGCDSKFAGATSAFFFLGGHPRPQASSASGHSHFEEWAGCSLNLDWLVDFQYEFVYATTNLRGKLEEGEDR